MRPNRIFTASVLGILPILAVLGADTVRAEDDTITKCIAANNQGLDVRNRGQLLEARKMLAQCASPACGDEVSDACQKRIAEINERLPAIIFVPKNGKGDDVAGVKLSVDGVPDPATLDGRAVVLDPGEHEFRFEVAGLPPVVKRFVLREREQNRREEILIGPPASPPPAPRPDKPTTDQGTVIYVNPGGKPALDSTGSFQRTTGTLLLAAALPAAIITGATFGALAAANWNTAKNDSDNRNAQKELAAARSAATGSNIAFSLAGVLLVGGIVLRVSAPARRPIAPTLGDVHVTPAVGDRAAGLFASGSFQ